MRYMPSHANEVHRVALTVGARTVYLGPYASATAARSLLTLLEREANGEAEPPRWRAALIRRAQQGEVVQGEVQTLRGTWSPS